MENKTRVPYIRNHSYQFNDTNFEILREKAHHTVHEQCANK